MKRRDRAKSRDYDPLVAFDRLSLSPSLAGAGDVWLVDAMQINPPSWLEAVAIVQGVSLRLGAGQMPPMIGDLVITARGEVRFPPGGVADQSEVITTLCRLLDRMIGTQCYPMDVWLVLERARSTPGQFVTPADFATAFQRLAPFGGPARLAAYVIETAALRRHHPVTSRPAAGDPAPWFLRRGR